jgi:hypothetical protein
MKTTYTIGLKDKFVRVTAYNFIKVTKAPKEIFVTKAEAGAALSKLNRRLDAAILSTTTWCDEYKKISVSNKARLDAINAKLAELEALPYKEAAPKIKRLVNERDRILDRRDNVSARVLAQELNRYLKIKAAQPKIVTLK